MSKITEGEITSIVRQFFVQNGFSFLSTLGSGEKLYYTINGNRKNNKQPDTIVYKGETVIVCEDKIVFNDLIRSGQTKIGDFDKLVFFLSSEEDLEMFRMKLKTVLPHDSIRIVGCLSSIRPRKAVTVHLLRPEIMYLSIEIQKNNCALVVLHANADLESLFTVRQMNIDF